jgi:hypothetical protein
MNSRAIQPGVTKIGVNALPTLPIFTGIVPADRGVANKPKETL